MPMSFEPTTKPDLQISYDREVDTLVIDGVRFSGDLFRNFADSALLPVGVAFRLIGRNDGVIVLERVPSC